MITVHWHLIVMIVITIFLLVSIFRESEFGLDLSGFFYGAIIVIMWAIYGGIFLW
jgi:hypothetical protein